MTTQLDDSATSPLDDDQLLAFLAGMMTPDEANAFEAQAARSEAGMTALHEAKIAWSATQPEAVDAQTDEFLATLRQRISATPVPTLEHRVPAGWSGRSANVSSSRTLWRFAAGGVLGAVLLTLGWFSRDVASLQGTPSPRTFLYTTENGERATVTLPDGSTALLNVASRLEVPADFDRGNRTLKLQGAALFTVNHNASAPFIVVAGASTTRVLGTRFMVRHYATDTAATIAVRDGKVAVASTILTAAQQLVVNERGASDIQPASADQFAFSSGMLTFNDVTLPDAIPELNRWFDADIRLGSAVLSTRKVSGQFKAGSLTDLTAVLALMFDVRIVQHGRVLTLYSRD